MHIRFNILRTLIILIGSIVILAIIFPNGTRFCFNKNICGIAINNKYKHDSLWHISLAEIGFNQVPFTNPSQSGSKLIGYNYLLDLVMFLLMKIGISAWFSFFKLLPIIFVILYPLLIIRYCKQTGKTKLQTDSILFFCYFGCSLGFVFSLYYWKSLANSSLWEFPNVDVLQSGTILYNLQFAFSILTVLWILPHLEKKRLKFTDCFILFIATFLATGFKLYAGMTITALFFFYYIFYFFRNNKTDFIYVKKMLVILAGFLTAVLIFYNPFDSLKSGSIFVLDPLAFSRQMIENQHLFYSQNLTDARYYLYGVGNLSKKLVMIESYSIFLFMVYNLGTRIIIFPYIVYQFIKKKFSNEEFSLFFTYLSTFIFNLLFVQKGDWFNTMQFLFYGIFLTNILTGLALVKFWKWKKNLFINPIIILIISLTILGNVNLLSFYKKNINDYSYISDLELDALNFLKKLPPGDVFTPQIANLYIPALTTKPAYLNDVQQLANTGIDFLKRLYVQKNFQKTGVDNISAKYYYVDKNYEEDKKFASLTESNKKFKLLYKEGEILIFEK